MFRLVNQVADRMLARFVPRVDAAAECVQFWQFCYCSGGLAYRRRCYDCGSFGVICGLSCQVTGTC
jgi:hypothetical protein